MAVSALRPTTRTTVKAFNPAVADNPESPGLAAPATPLPSAFPAAPLEHRRPEPAAVAISAFP